MAFDSDEEERRARGAASKSDPSELGKLAAELPASERRSSAPPGSDGDDAINPLDQAAIAALSKGSAARPTAVVPPARSSSFGWLIGLAIGFVAGVPVGGILFPHTTVVSVPAPKSPTADREAQLAAAEARARKADEIAAAVRLPSQRLAEQGQPPAAEQAAEPAPPSAAEQAPPAAAEVPPAAASAAAPPGMGSASASAAEAAAARNQPPPNAHSREAARVATAALNAGPAKPADAPATQASTAAQPSAATPATPAPAPVPAVGATGPDGRKIDDLLDQALSSTAAKQEQARVAQADRALVAANTIPVVPSRDDVTRSMTVILPAIRGCAAGQSGLATVGIVVKNDGRVESVSVTGAPFEGDRSGRCMEGVVRRAKFPRFQQSSFRIQFPFAIQ
ncbi:MAG TPA: hypothetical protein VFG30_25205 [Polyangiales bacterium]|nr:hypothetical protein [Polyangiales bacterium]